MGAVVLLIQLLAGEDGLLGVDDDNAVAAVGVGGKLGLALAPQQVGGDDSGLAHGLAGGVDDVPLPLGAAHFGHERGHR